MQTHIHIVQHLRPGGIESLVLELVKQAPADERHLIVSLEGEMESAVDAWPRLQGLRRQMIFLGKRAGNSPRLLWRLALRLRRLAPTSVHTHHVGPLLYGGLAARLAGVPHIIHTEHDAWHLEVPRRRRLQCLLLALVRPRLVADAEGVAAATRCAIRGVEPLVIRNGIDCQRFTPGDAATARTALGLPQGVLLIGSAGRQVWIKGHDLLLQAVAQLPGVHLALAGDGSEAQSLRELARRLGIEARVHFIGHYDEMPTFYRALDLFCLPSRAEGMPLSTLEAQACGVRCVVTEVGSVVETLCPETAIRVPPEDPVRLAAALDLGLRPNPHSPRDFVLRNADLRETRRAYAALRRDADPLLAAARVVPS